MFTIRMPRYEPLSPDDLALLERGWKRLVSEIGVKFAEPGALELFARRGRRSTATSSASTESMLEQVAKAPSEFHCMRATRRTTCTSAATA